MTQAPNPFTPAFGQIPPFMAGRADDIREIVRAFDRGVGDPALSTIFVGARGSGKTALLTYLGEEALSHGWITASVSAVPGMLGDIEERTLAAAREFVDAPDKLKLEGVTIGQLFGIERENSPESSGNWRTRMTNILEKLNKHDVGLLILVDEVRVDLDDMIQLASAYQHFVREGRKVSLLMAGLPSKVSSLLRDDSVSFLRRANYRQLGRIRDEEVLIAVKKTVESAHGSIEEEALDKAVAHIGGFPYMMQLVGFYMWESALSDGESKDVTISPSDARQGAELAALDIEKKILETTCRELSKGDLRFLEAMLEDEGEESSLSDIAQRMGKKSNYASQYKRRLLTQGVLEDRGHGTVAVEVPLLKDYLRKRLSR